MTDGSFHSFTLVVRHGACLYFARDGLPARYGKVVAALVVQGTWIRGFSLFFVNGIKTESRLTDGGSWRPFRAVPYLDDYRTQSNATKKQCRNKPYV